MTWRGRHIYLWGLPGAGKTSIGKELTRLLAKSGYGFVDLDALIEEKAGLTIADIFDSFGEEYFRSFETEVLSTLAQQQFEHKPFVIATGGGTPISAANRAIMRGSGVTIWIDVTTKQAAKNIINSALSGKHRPLLRVDSPEELQARLRILQNERTESYEQATLHFVTRTPSGETRSTEDLAKEMLKALEQMSKRILLRPRFEVFQVSSALGAYPVSIGSGIAAQELAFTARERKAGRLIVISDEKVVKLYLPKFFQQITKEARKQIEIINITLPSGESHKDMKTLQELLDAFNRLGVKRKEDIIVSLGGGVTSDIAGFAASLYMRGMPLIHIPTTLIGQVDAALGGKTGVDYHSTKNLIGTFYPPNLVIVDPLFLKTLSKRELQAGLSEVLKYGLISSPELWQTLSKSMRRLLRGFDTGYEVIVRDAVKEKIRFIEWDEFERKHGARELLNFGHSFAHAIESANGFERVLHGEAVALGMRAASWLSMELGYINSDTWREIEQTLGRIPVPQDIVIEADKILEHMKKDKKQKRTNYRLVLIEDIGKALVVDDIQESKVREAIGFIESVV